MNDPTNKIILNLDSNANVYLNGFIAPFEYSSYGYYKEWEELANIQVAEPVKQYTNSVFQAFLPPDPVAVGNCWQIQEDAVLTLLKQLYPRPQLKLHIDSGDSRGLWACLRAYNNEIAQVHFRIHAQFKMESGWLTPSQFAGHLTINRIQKKVVSFNMYVPPTTVNFDIGWTQEDSTFADLGFCPRMELWTDTKLEDVEFIESISQEKAERLLLLRYYKSQQINWVSLEEALELAPTLQKPIHAIAIDGPLADESC